MKKIILTLIFLPTMIFAGNIKITIFPVEATIILNGGKYTNKQLKHKKFYYLANGNYTIFVSDKGYFSKTYNIKIGRKNKYIEDKLEKKYQGLRLIKEFRVKGQPKSIVWLDNQRFEVNLLNGHGVALFSMTNTNLIRLVQPPQKYAKAKGFVEGLVDEEQNEIYISQMTKNAWHVFSLDKFEYKKTLSAKGIWTKVIAKNDKYIFLSNWESDAISVFDRFTKKFVKRIKVAGIPRGMGLTPDQKYLYVAIFSFSMVQKIDLEKMKVVKTITLSDNGKGAARHIVRDAKKNIFYISDMSRATIYKLDYTKDKIIDSVKVYSKPNTIVLSRDKSRLFVSSRAPNGPDGYLNKSWTYGQVQVIDTETMDITAWIWGRNQTTGLGISPDGKILVVGNFYDNNIEIYQVYSGLTCAVFGGEKPYIVK